MWILVKFINFSVYKITILGLIKNLGKQTFIYGLAYVIPRILNYFLAPLHTNVFTQEEYGVITEIFAYVTFFIILFTYGMETAYFRFVSKEANSKKVFGTALISITFTSVLFSSVLIAFSQPIADLLSYPDHAEYIVWFALILGFDAIVAIPFAQLRFQNKARTYAAIKILNIVLNVGINLFFLLPILGNKYILWIYEYINFQYDPNIGVGYVFIANLIASISTVLLLLPVILKFKITVDRVLWKKMLAYGLPMLVVGLAGMVNETIDRILLKNLLPLPLSGRLAQVGIYGACYKLSIFMTLAIQAFRMAAEPFFFKHAAEKNAQQLYAKVLQYFVIICSLIFLLIVLYIDVVKYFIGTDFHEGLGIVPILLLANMFLGIYYNLSIWYKLTDKIHYGAYISIGGALLTIVLNVWWIPIFGYWGSAWATLLCYASMMVASYVLGQQYYPVPYNINRITFYILFAIIVYLFNYLLQELFIIPSVLMYLIGTACLIIYIAIVYVREFHRQDNTYESKNS